MELTKIKKFDRDCEMKKSALGADFLRCVKSAILFRLTL